MLNLPKFTFINGPPGSGKSTLADLLMRQEEGLWRESFAQPIRDMMYAVFYPEEGPISFTFDLREADAKKSFVPAARENMSNRHAMISFSENWMKPTFGEDIFGRLLHARCKEQEEFYEKFIIDDSGFLPEAQYIVAQEGAANCHLIRLHRSGCDYEGDSRGYIYLSGVQALDLNNDGPPSAMLDTLALEFGNL